MQQQKQILLGCLMSLYCLLPIISMAMPPPEQTAGESPITFLEGGDDPSTIGPKLDTSGIDALTAPDMITEGEEFSPGPEVILNPDDLQGPEDSMEGLEDMEGPSGW